MLRNSFCRFLSIQDSLLQYSCSDPQYLCLTNILVLLLSCCFLSFFSSFPIHNYNRYVPLASYQRMGERSNCILNQYIVYSIVAPRQQRVSRKFNMSLMSSQGMVFWSMHIQDRQTWLGSVCIVCAFFLAVKWHHSHSLYNTLDQYFLWVKMTKSNTIKQG